MFYASLLRLKKIHPNLSKNIRLITTLVYKDKALFKKPEWTVQARNNSDKKNLVTQERNSEVSTNVKEIVKETTKTASYSAVILFGLSVTAMLFYVIFRELFSSKSPNNVYSKALDRCLKETKVVDVLGEPIRGFGEDNSRGRRRYVGHRTYEVDGVTHMRMRFYLKGSRKSATAQLEVKENKYGDFEFRYLFIQLDDYPHRVIVIEDNRENMSKDINEKDSLISLELM